MAVASSGVRERERAAMRRVIAERGFEHAIDSIVTAVSVEVAGDADERRLERVSRVVEANLLDRLVVVARALGWAPAT